MPRTRAAITIPRIPSSKLTAKARRVNKTVARNTRIGIKNRRGLRAAVLGGNTPLTYNIGGVPGGFSGAVR